ncbi:hypothetical protein Salat_0491500 [Sesamum alatum]|uniref:Uncharacterized protein n=1 Tax=Sesamum alatum TaxID=300844 RepID=A0AAE1Z429_9LAMI|nr:hypothetical protein Salat_0491500 [Sesamum alatum]
MGCFLGCFAGAKDHNRRKRRSKRSNTQRNRVQNVQQESVTTVERTNTEITPTNLVSELINKASGEEQLSPSARKRVTFNSNITTYEHVSVQESYNSLPECNENVGKEKQEDLTGTGQSHSQSEDDSSVVSSVGSYPPNHRYHNARDSDDEAEEYGDSDPDEFADSDDEDDYSDYDEHTDGKISGQEVSASMESRTESRPAAQATNDEVESRIVKIRPPDEEVRPFGSKGNTRDKNGYVNSVLNPIENITQWKAAKSKGTAHPLTRQKENSAANFEAPRLPFTSQPVSKSKSNQATTGNQEIAVEASLSNWLVSPPKTIVSKKASFSGLETVTPGKTMSDGSSSLRSFEDRPILGALTVEELRQISATPSSKGSPSRSPDEMPIIGTVGTYWNHSASSTVSGSASSYKYREVGAHEMRMGYVLH